MANDYITDITAPDFLIPQVIIDLEITYYMPHPLGGCTVKGVKGAISLFVYSVQATPL